MTINLFNFAYPQIFRLTIDEGIIQRNGNVIILSVAVLIVGAAIRGGLSFIQGYVTEGVSQSAAYDLRNELYERVQTLSFSYHDQAQAGQLLTRTTNDVEIIRRFLGQGFLQFTSFTFGLIGTSVILIVMNPTLGLASLVSLPIIAVILRYFVVQLPQRIMGVQSRLSALDTVLEENLAGIRVVKAFGREDFEMARYDQINDDLLRVNNSLVRTLSIRTPVITYVANLSVALIIWVGGNAVVSREITIGQLVAFITYLNFLMQPLMGIGALSNLAVRAIASARRVFEVMDAESDVRERPDALRLDAIDGRIEFRDVSMRYAGSVRHALKNVSFTVEPGQVLAIVGATGSGKSTIAHLIPRFYDPLDGQILVDNVDIRDVTLESLRQHIAVVMQDTLLFSGSIRDNIAFGRPEAHLDEVVAVARAAQAHEFIVELPDGYDTVLGEAGTGLSGGQKQRVAIARALLLDSRILILDDSTSSVDAETEYQIQMALDLLIRGRTTVIIAQRLTSVRRADQILLVDDAEVVAKGSHEELLETSLLYREIVTSQLFDDTLSVPAGRAAG